MGQHLSVQHEHNRKVSSRQIDVRANSTGGCTYVLLPEQPYAVIAVAAGMSKLARKSAASNPLTSSLRHATALASKGTSHIIKACYLAELMPCPQAHSIHVAATQQRSASASKEHLARRHCCVLRVPTKVMATP